MASSIPALKIEETLHPVIELLSGAIQLMRETKEKLTKAGFPTAQEEEPTPQTTFLPYTYHHRAFTLAIKLEIKDVGFKGIEISVIFSENVFRSDLTAIGFTFDVMQDIGRIEYVHEFDRFFNAMTRIFGQDQDVLERLIQKDCTFDRKSFLAYIDDILTHAKSLSTPSSC